MPSAVHRVAGSGISGPVAFFVSLEKRVIYPLQNPEKCVILLLFP